MTVTYPRVDQNGHLVPWLSDWLRGYREALRLKAEGMDVAMDRASLTRLGKALADAMPPMTDERKAELLEMARRIESRARIEQAQIIEATAKGTFRSWEPDWMLALDRRVMTAPEPGTTATPDIPDTDGSSGVDQGQGRPARRERRQGPRVRSVSYVANNRGVRDPMQYEPDDDDWS